MVRNPGIPRSIHKGKPGSAVFLRLQGRGAGRVPLPERNGEGCGGDCHGYAKRAVSKTVKFHAVILIEHMFHIKSRGVEFADQRLLFVIFYKNYLQI